MKIITTVLFCTLAAPSFAQNCENWLEETFWYRAGPVEVFNCRQSRRLEERNENGVTALHLAAAYGFTPAVTALSLSPDIMVNEGDDTGYTPLHYAAKNNPNPDMITLLLELGASVDIWADYAESPLDLAAGYNTVDVVKALLNAGADPAPTNESKSHRPETPIMYAARSNPDPQVLQVLLDAGADLNASDMRQNSLLHLAVQSENQPEILQMLVAAGIDVDQQNMDGLTPLHMAVSIESNVMLIDTLIALGGDVNTADKWGNTPLHSAAAVKGNLEIILRLLAAGADINAREIDGFTPLHFAANYPDTNVIMHLIQMGADPSIRSIDGTSPYDKAKLVTGLQGTEVLAILEYGASSEMLPACLLWSSYDFWQQATLAKVLECLPSVDVNSSGFYGQTPVMMAVGKTEAAQILQALLAAGADVNGHDDQMYTALHTAAALELLEITVLLVENGADINARTLQNQTPLHAATEHNGMTKTAIYLVSVGADPNALDVDGRRAGGGN